MHDRPASKPGRHRGIGSPQAKLCLDFGPRVDRAVPVPKQWTPVLMMLRVRESQHPTEDRNLQACSNTSRGARSSFRDLPSRFRPDSTLEKWREMTDLLLVARLVWTLNSVVSSPEHDQRRLP